MAEPTVYLGKQIHEFSSSSYSQNNDYFIFQRVNELQDGNTYKISHLNLFKNFVSTNFSKYDIVDTLDASDVLVLNRSLIIFRTSLGDIQNFVLNLAQSFILTKETLSDNDWLFVFDTTSSGEKKSKITFKNLLNTIQNALIPPKIKINLTGDVIGTSGASFIELEGNKTVIISTTVLASSHTHDGQYAALTHTHPISDISNYIRPKLIAGNGIQIEENVVTNTWTVSEIKSVSDIRILAGFGMTVTQVGTTWTLAMNPDAVQLEAGDGIDIDRDENQWTITNTDPGSGITLLAGANVRIDKLSATEWKIVSLLH